MITCQTRGSWAESVMTRTCMPGWILVVIGSRRYFRSPMIMPELPSIVPSSLLIIDLQANSASGAVQAL